MELDKQMLETKYDLKLDCLPFYLRRVTIELCTYTGQSMTSKLDPLRLTDIYVGTER